MHLNDRFQLYKNNLKETWRLIGTLIKRKTKHNHNHLVRLVRNNKILTKQTEIAEQFNQHFINVAQI